MGRIGYLRLVRRDRRRSARRFEKRGLVLADSRIRAHSANALVRAISGVAPVAPTPLMEQAILPLLSSNDTASEDPERPVKLLIAAVSLLENDITTSDDAASDAGCA
jgi:hypothetical protein